MAEEARGNLHIVPMPKWSSALGCTRLAIAVLTMSFVAACTAVWGGFSAFIFTMITASYTLLVFIYYIVSLSRKPELYHPYAILALEAVGTVFWLISMILLAEWASAANSIKWWIDDINFYYPTETTSVPPTTYEGTFPVLQASHYSLPDKYNVTIKLATVGAVLAGLQFVLFLITTVVFAVNLRKHRAAGFPSMSGRPMNTTAAGTISNQETMVENTKDNFNSTTQEIHMPTEPRTQNPQHVSPDTV